MFNEKLHNVLEHNCIQQNKNIFMMGDFNINLLQHETHSPTDSFLNTMISHGLLPCITKASRVTDDTASLIDNIFTNVDISTCKSALLYSDISDHYPVLLQCRTKSKGINENKRNHIPHQCLKRQYTQSSIENFQQYLLNLNWSMVYDSLEEKGSNMAYDQFLNPYNYGFDKYFPKKVRTLTKIALFLEKVDDFWLGKNLVKLNRIFLRSTRIPILLKLEIILLHTVINCKNF